MGKFDFSLSNLSLTRRLWVAIALTTLLPTITAIYYFSHLYITSIAIVILAFVVILGWFLVFQIVSSIIKICAKSQAAMEQMKDKNSALKGAHNEVESLDIIFNMLSSKVKESVEELQAVSDKTAQLNRAIAQKVNVFSSILQATTLFSRGEKSRNIFQFLAERLRETVKANASIIFLKKIGQDSFDAFFSGTDETRLRQVQNSKEFNNILQLHEKYIYDAKRNQDKFNFARIPLDFKNMIISPIYLKYQTIGFIVIGNFLDNFVFSSDDSEVIEFFCQNIGIVWEHERLTNAIAGLEKTDPLTATYNAKFFLARFEEEIQRATTYQRPCGLVVMEIINYSEYKDKAGVIALEGLLKRIAEIFKEFVRPIDILGRMREDRIAAILIEKNKRQSLEVIKGLKDAFVAIPVESTGIVAKFSFVLAENPIDGATAAQLLESVERQLKAA